MVAADQIYRGYSHLKKNQDFKTEELIDELAHLYNNEGREVMLNKMATVYADKLRQFQDDVYDSKSLPIERKRKMVHFFRAQIEEGLHRIKLDVHKGFYWLGGLCGVGVVLWAANTARAVFIGFGTIATGCLITGGCLIGALIGLGLVEGTRWLLSKWNKNAIKERFQNVQIDEPVVVDKLAEQRVQARLEEMERLHREWQISSAYFAINVKEDRTTNKIETHGPVPA